jgi:hypothetical protein
MFQEILQEYQDGVATPIGKAQQRGGAPGRRHGVHKASTTWPATACRKSQPGRHMPVPWASGRPSHACGCS